MTISTSILDPTTAARRLLWMGVKGEDCREALSIGYQHASTCTSNHPLSLAGFDAWGWSLGHLRELLIQRGGWTIDRTGNFETVLNESEGIAIAVVAGDSGTGLANGFPPRTRTPRGPATERAVEHNQLNLLGAVQNEGHLQTWLLMHFLDSMASEIRAELSLPNDISQKVIDSWEERILFEPIPYGGNALAAPLPVQPEESVDVDVRRKAA
jgi:hypothetical protein